MGSDHGNLLIPLQSLSREMSRPLRHQPRHDLVLLLRNSLENIAGTGAPRGGFFLFALYRAVDNRIQMLGNCRSYRVGHDRVTVSVRVETITTE